MAQDKMEVSIKLKLYPEDFEHLRRKAASGGLSFEELFEYFAGDLACGNARSGSDECDLAIAWYDRHSFDEFAEKTFVKFLIDDLCSMEEVFDYLNWIDVDLDLLDQDIPEDQKKEYTEEIEQCAFALAELYEDYCSRTETPQCWMDAMKAVWKYAEDEARLSGAEEVSIISADFWDKISEIGDRIKTEAKSE